MPELCTQIPLLRDIWECFGCGSTSRSSTVWITPPIKQPSSFPLSHPRLCQQKCPCGFLTYLITEVIWPEKYPRLLFQVSFVSTQISSLRHFTTQLHKQLPLAEHRERGGVGTNAQRKRGSQGCLNYPCHQRNAPRTTAPAAWSAKAQL